MLISVTASIGLSPELLRQLKAKLGLTRLEPTSEKNIITYGHMEENIAQHNKTETQTERYDGTEDGNTASD